MKLLSLRIININSLQGEFFIDFETKPLKNAGLYAITGPTGSGKSTILDAITLALYDKTPRQDSVSKSDITDYGAIVNRFSDNATAEVIYSVNDKKYLSKWSIRKNRNGKFNDYEMEVAEYKNGNFEIIESKRSNVKNVNQKIIGLDYEQFVKSVLLSQGDFAKFLKAKPNDRSKILETITNSGIYRQLGKKAYEKYRETLNEKDKLKQRVEDVNLLSTDETEEINKKIKLLEKDKLLLNKELSEINKKLDIKLKINEIESVLEKSNKHLEENDKLKQDSKILENKLLLHEKILPLKSDIDRLQNISAEIQDIEDKVINIKNRNKQIDEKISVLKSDYTGLLEKEKKFLLQKKEKEEIFEQIEILDNQITTNKVKLSDTEKQYQEATKNKNIVLEKSKAVYKQISEIEIKITTAQNWLKQNKTAERILSDINLLKDKKQNFAKLITELNQSIEKNKNHDNDVVFNSKFINKDLHEKFEEITEKIKTISEKISFYKEKITTKKTIEELNKLREIKKNEETILIKMVNLSENYKKNLSQINEKQKLNKELEARKNDLSAKLKKHENELKIIQAQIKELSAKKEKELLESKYKDDRLKLKENQPCPLCGAVEHPYVKNYVSDLSSTEKKLKQTEKELADLENEKKNIENQILELSQTIKNNINTIENEKKENIELINNFSKINHFKNVEIQDVEKIKQKIEEIKSEAKEIENQLLFKQNAQKAEIFLKIWNEIYNKTQTCILLQTETESLLEKFSAYFKKTDDLDQKIEKLEQISKKYIQTKEISDNLINKIEKLKVEALSYKNQLNEIEEHITSISEKLAKKKKEIDLLKQKRQNLFGDKIVKQERQKLLKTAEELKEKINTTNLEIKKLETSKKELSENLKELLNEKTKKERIFSELKQTLEPKINKIGFANIEECKTAILNQNKADEISRKINTIKETETKLKAVISQKINELEKLKQQDDKKVLQQDLENRIKEIKEKTENLIEEIGKNLRTLENNQTQKEKYSALSKQYDKISKEFKKWNALKQIIGDAEGNTFAKYAQDLTLKHLLKFANEKLQKLNNRYILIHEKNEKIDEFFVIDTDMGNQKRSTTTLSGGETFLVSLALALGLSDLASNKTKIESLFIDEGFGALDEKTLDTALSTLENLQFKNNISIGIISHIKELQERINTKIILQKNQMGISSLEIQG